MAVFQDPHLDPSSLMPFQDASTDWMGKDALDLFSWDMPFDEPFDVANDFVDPPAYTTSTSASPEDYNSSSRQAPEDALSFSSLASDAESDAWSSSAPRSPTQSRMKRPSTDSIFDRPAKRSPSSAAQDDLSEKTVSNTTTTPATSAATSSTSSSSSSSSKEDTTTRKASPKSTSQSTSQSTSSKCTTTDADTNAVMKRKKAAHNAIEKRYRTNMNAKFVALGNAIPKSAAHLSQSTNKGLRKSTFGEQPPQNKSEILTGALAYIRELQEENRLLRNELNVLKENLLPGGSQLSQSYFA
ncbi:HLH DNA binding domain protein [Rasamsonia emersonii CBS 393.64]|uniref:HLH DNA binding domain protein n=1 Tax=Rasamsonia emersonii (strain ATCC 16479 / CBS 393.64 / IMI 116815) TaxID=1408163 RepID=A0A0F4YU33_RASE3|nr:HLH DNA binding domain protein [Rasamsonia emersonii CBS 393.64]KKA21792.1 HLH DNA binding domain protein [Rasamsonia emersonii CBS 393.64]